MIPFPSLQSLQLHLAKKALKLDKDVVVAAVHRGSEASMYLPPPCTKDKARLGVLQVGTANQGVHRMECVSPKCWRCWRYKLKMLFGSNHDEFPGLWNTYDLCFYTSNSSLQLATVTHQICLLEWYFLSRTPFWDLWFLGIQSPAGNHVGPHRSLSPDDGFGQHLLGGWRSDTICIVQVVGDRIRSPKLTVCPLKSLHSVPQVIWYWDDMYLYMIWIV